MITGIDLVELQLRAAGGEVLPFTQDDLMINGHSFEARIYAKDPDSDFLPGTGRLDYLTTPMPGENIRIETGVRQGDEVSQFHDPMIAKLVVWDKTRFSALQKLKQKLQEYHIVGLSTNVKFLKSLDSHPKFETADVHTGFIDDHYAELFPKKELPSEYQLAQSALAILINEDKQIGTSNRLESNSPFLTLPFFQMNIDTERNMVLSDGVNECQIKVTILRNKKYLIKINDYEFECSGTAISDNYLSVDIDGKKEKYSVVLKDGAVNVFTNNDHFHVHQTKPRFILEQNESIVPEGAVAPMTGTILDIRVQPGDNVSAGDVVAVIYAMKLEHSICAPYDGVIEEVFVEIGAMVNKNDELVKINKAESK